MAQREHSPSMNKALSSILRIANVKQTKAKMTMLYKENISSWSLVSEV